MNPRKRYLTRTMSARIKYGRMTPADYIAVLAAMAATLAIVTGLALLSVLALHSVRAAYPSASPASRHGLDSSTDWSVDQLNPLIWQGNHVGPHLEGGG